MAWVWPRIAADPGQARDRLVAAISAETSGADVRLRLATAAVRLDQPG